MANLKISDLTDGEAIEAGDLIEIERPGSPSVSRKVPLGTAAGEAASAFAGSSHSHSNATTSAAGFMSASDKTKLDGVASGATSNTGTVTSVAISVPSSLSVSGGPITTSGTFTLSHASGYQGYTSTEATKLGHITVTQAVDLDAIETRVNALDAAVVLKGTWSAAGGSFPGSGTAQAGESWIVSAAGTVNSVAFNEGDRIIAITDNASTSTFASNWFKADYTDQVSSVAGRTGAVTLAQADISGLTTSDSPQFTGINLGHASDTTLTRTAAGRVAVEGVDVLLAGVADQTITGGARVTSNSLGTITTGTVTPDPGDRPMQHYTNNGAHTLAPGSNAGTYVLDITNGASAGAITVSGWTKVAGDAFTTTSGNKFRCHCSIGNAGSLIVVQALQ